MSFPAIHIDFETRSAVDLRKCGVDVYAEHESTDILCVAYAKDDDSEPELCLPEDFMKVLRSFPVGLERRLAAHNAAFEQILWNKVGVKKYGWPKTDPDRWYCTMVRALAMGLPASLEQACHAVGLEQGKDQAGRRVMLQLCKPRSVDDDGVCTWWDKQEFSQKYEALYAYCKQDVRLERELHKRLRPLSDDEYAVWQLDREINQRGIKIDVEVARTAISLIEFEKRRMDATMSRLTKGFVTSCTQNSVLLTWLQSQDVKLKAVDKPAIRAALEQPGLSDAIRQVLILRQEAAKTSTAKLKSMLMGASSDGRVREIFQYHGASTGRWAGRRLQTQNLPRPSLKQHEIEEVFGLLKEHSKSTR